MPVMIGTSGWQYDDWAGAFYPEGLPKSRWLESYSSRLATVESNNAFYRLPTRDLFARWADATPTDFVMSVKASRYITHIRRLREPEDPVKLLLERTEGLGHKLGAILLQLPPTLTADPDLLAGALSCFPKEVEVTVEVRHDSWYSDETRKVLESHGAALCITDTANRHSPLWRTAGFGYLRFHEGTAHPLPSYGRAALDRWAERIASMWSRTDRVYCYFNNDENSRAPYDAHHFALAVARHGLEPSRG